MAPLIHDQEAPPNAVQFIDMSPYLHGTDSDKAAVASQWRQACEEQGFIALQGHGIPLQLQRDMLTSMRTFFALPLSEKQKVDVSRSSCNRGYERSYGQRLEELDETALADSKEGFSFRQDRPEAGRFNQGPNLWPESDPDKSDPNVVEEEDVRGKFSPPRFRDVCERYYRACLDLAVTLFRITARSLDLPEDYFDSHAADPDGLTNCRGHRYPPASGTPGERGAGAHTDFGSLTILLQDDVGGLEIMHRPSGTWRQYRPVEDTLVVNMGDLMQRWTNGRYKSTMHRVIGNREGRERYSVVVFCGMALDTVVECLPTCVRDGERPLYPPITVEDHYRKRYTQTYGAAGTEYKG